jgi:hypothetical protein
LPGEINPKIGNTEPTTIKLKLSHPILLADLDLSYKLYEEEIETHKHASLSIKKLNLSKDPAFKISVKSLAGQNVVLITKPEYMYTNRNTPGKEVTRNYRVSVKSKEELENTSTQLFVNLADPLYIEEIEIYVGSRSLRQGIIFTRLEVSASVLTPAEEEVVVLEPMFKITTGYTGTTDITKPAQDPGRLSSTVTSPDMHDALEASGLCEFWKPGDLHKEKVATLGKLRKHWANKFDTIDTRKFFFDTALDEDVLFLHTLNAEYAERLQQSFIDFIIQADIDLFNKLLKQVLYLQLSSQDLYKLNSYFNVGVVNVISQYLYDYKQGQGAQLVSKGELPEGWQDVGYEACIVGETRWARCVPRAAVVFEALSHDICRPGSKIFIPTHTITDAYIFSGLDLINRAGTGIEDKIRETKEHVVKDEDIQLRKTLRNLGRGSN